MRSERRSVEIATACEDEIRGMKFYNYPLVVAYKNKRVLISSSKSDSIHLFRIGDQTIVLSTNFNLEYAGVEVVDWEHGKVIANVFFQNINDYPMGLGDYLKKDFFEYAEINQAKILLEYAEGSQ